MNPIKTVLVLCLLIGAGVSLVRAGEIHQAARRGQIDQLKAILATQPELANLADGDGWTPLHHACRGGQLAAVAELISHGADADVWTHAGLSPLTYAVGRGDTAIVNLLVDAGVGLESLTERDESLLHFAVVHEKPAMVRFLIDRGLDPNQAKTGKITPLHLAALLGQAEAAQMLIVAGADIDAVSYDGATPLHYAIAAGYDALSGRLRAAGASERPRGFPELRGDYMSQPDPGSVPELFLPELFSDIYRPHSCLVFSPDGSEAFWEVIFVAGGRLNSLWHMKQVDGRWQAPAVPSFAQGRVAGGPAFSADGNRLFFHSLDFPPEGGRPDMNIWYVDRTENGWGEAKPLGAPASNPGSHEVYPSLASDGSLYFHLTGRGGADVFVSRYVDGAYTGPERLAAPINTDKTDACPSIASDQSYLVFHSNRHTEGYRHRLYVSFRPEGDGWGEPLPLDLAEHNHVACTSPGVTPDGHYLFFCADKNIRWVNASAIERLR